MAFDPNSPFAMACAQDKAKTEEAVKILMRDASIEERTKDLSLLAQGWNVPMSAQEASEIVAEFDNVIKASHPRMPMKWT